MDIIREITPLSEKDCFYIVDRRKTEFTYPIHCHSEYELNFIEHAPGVRRMVGDSAEVIGEYELVLITGKELEHVWEQNACKSPLIHEDHDPVLSRSLREESIGENQFNSIRKMLEKAQCGISFPMSSILKVYHLLEKLVSEEQSFYAVINFLTILYELSVEENYKVLASSSFAKITDIHSESRRIQKVQNYINERYQQDIRLNQLAELVGMAPSAFSRFFKLRTGKTLSDYITDIRIGYAARMLVDTQRSIAEICYDCGFNNLSNFNRIFKKRKTALPKSSGITTKRQNHCIRDLFNRDKYISPYFYTKSPSLFLHTSIFATSHKGFHAYGYPIDVLKIHSGKKYYSWIK